MYNYNMNTKEKPKVLIIDDEAEILKMYKDAFTANNFEVETAQNGESGVQKLTDYRPDVILLDILMPRVNGLDVLEIIKKDSEIKNIPVYFLTNLPEESAGEKANKLGAAGYLVKAFNEPNKVVELIKQKLTI